MFNIESPVAVELTGTTLEWVRAFTAVEEAISVLEDAGAALNPLIYESEWQAYGVRALHDLIVELKTRTAIEIGELGTRLWEIKLRATP
ncbi:hypothetical protein [Microbacterium sp. A93]|uniref:hypothetical protein n=1 Tax=unclassified Microbacterium TaxID=2609290 RepID=UPI003F430AEA